MYEGEISYAEWAGMVLCILCLAARVFGGNSFRPVCIFLPLYYQQGHGVHPASGDLQGSAGQNRPWDVHRACVPCIQ